MTIAPIDPAAAPPPQVTPSPEHKAALARLDSKRARVRYACEHSARPVTTQGVREWLTVHGYPSPADRDDRPYVSKVINEWRREQGMTDTAGNLPILTDEVLASMDDARRAPALTVPVFAEPPAPDLESVELVADVGAVPAPAAVVADPVPVLVSSSPAPAATAVVDAAPVVAPSSAPAPAADRPRRALTFHTGLSLVAILAVFVAGAWWSFEEQRRLAEHFRFTDPWVFPLLLDGMAVALAVTAFSAALDGRAAVVTRLIAAACVGWSAEFNAQAVLSRWPAEDHDRWIAVAMAIVAPIVAYIAFERLLHEVRRQVARIRGQRPPAAVTPPRLVRLLLDPWGTFVTWRRVALDLTDPRRDQESA